MIEIALLRAITLANDYNKVKHYVTSDAIDEHTRMIVKVIEEYWELMEDTGRTSADMDVVRSMFFNTHPAMQEDSKQIFSELFNRMCTPLTATEQSIIINGLIEQELAVTLANGVAKYESGDEMDVIQWAFEVANTARDKMTLVTESNFATIATLTESTKSTVHYNWPLHCLANAFKPMTGARQTILAGLSDIGKTSFALNIAVAWARQTQSPILWLNNEGDRSQVILRAYCIMFATDEDMIVKWADDGTLYNKLVETFGREDPIRVYDIHRMDARQVEELIKKVHSTVGVGGVFFDMIDNIDMYVSNKTSRTDQVLEKKYQWSRSLGVELDYPTVAMSQQSESNEYVQWPKKADLKDSKVGKQGASDNIIYITQPQDDTIQDIRYISAPKNKTALKGSRRLRAEVKFHRDTGILYD